MKSIFCLVSEKFEYCGGRYMMRASIAIGKRAGVNCCLTAVRYTSEILKPRVVCMTATINPTFVFMDDNGGYHVVGARYRAGGVVHVLSALQF